MVRGILCFHTPHYIHTILMTRQVIVKKKDSFYFSTFCIVSRAVLSLPHMPSWCAQEQILHLLHLTSTSGLNKNPLNLATELQIPYMQAMSKCLVSCHASQNPFLLHTVKIVTFIYHYECTVYIHVHTVSTPRSCFITVCVRPFCFNVSLPIYTTS